MNWLKDRIKSETQKYQERLSKPSEPNPEVADTHAEAEAEADSVSRIPRLRSIRHIDARSLCFDPEPNHHTTHHDHHAVSSPDSTPSTAPITIKTVTTLGNIHSLTTHMIRDLGFAGRLGSHTLLSYGDTLYTDSRLCSTPFRGMTSNSIALATHNPCHVVDTNLNSSGYPDQFVHIKDGWGEEMSTHSIGITNVIETDPPRAEGVVFTLLNHRPDGTDHLLGAGIAKVSLSTGEDGLPVPHAERIGPYIWDAETEPWYGDVGAINTKGYVYVYGHVKDNPWVYLARVKVNEVLSVECYEYWHGVERGWSSERLRRDTLGEEQSVFWQVNQGQVVWNAYYQRYLFLYCDKFWSSTILLRSAPSPEGPWSDVINVYKCPPITEGGTIYAACPHPYFDYSGRTLVVTFTNHPNCVQGVRIEFE